MKSGNAVLLAVIAASCGLARAMHAVEDATGDKTIQQDDAEFWERFLGNYYKKKKATPAPMSTDAPTDAPTFPPTFAPTANPTPAPGCLVDATVTCSVPDPANPGSFIPCEDFFVPDGDCSVIGPPEVVSFSYQPDSCSNSDNGQSDNPATCSNDVPPGSTATISCTDSGGTPLPLNDCNENSPGSPSIDVAEGEEFCVNPVGEDATLPSPITCSIQSGDCTQVVTIDVSGDSTLNLKDTFCSLQLESCDDKDCLQEAVLEYAIINVGDTDMVVTNVTGTVNDGPPFQLVDLVDPNPIPVGETVVVNATVIIDFCVAEIPITGFIDARPNNTSPTNCVEELELIIRPPGVTPFPTASPTSEPTGEPSTSPSTTPSAAPSLLPSAAPSTTPSDTPTAAPSSEPSSEPSAEPSAEPSEAPTVADICIVTTSVSCEIPDPLNPSAPATPCEEFIIPDGDCTVGDSLTIVSFAYLPDSCSNSDNGQDDTPGTCSGDVPPTSPAAITCTGPNSTPLVLTSTPSGTGTSTLEVNEGDVFFVKNPGAFLQPLPSPITCNIVTPGCTQTVTIDVSQGSPLNLKDTFCSLQLESCNAKDCQQEAVLTYSVINSGGTDMLVTNVTGQVNDEPPFQLVDEVNPNPIPVGTTVEVDEGAVIDFCLDDPVTITGFVDARPDNQSPTNCVAETELIILPPGVTPFPTASPTSEPTGEPSNAPSSAPTTTPSSQPSSVPTTTPSSDPSAQPSSTPTASPSSEPSSLPTGEPSNAPSAVPTTLPSTQPSVVPTSQPSSVPTTLPTSEPTASPTSSPTSFPTGEPTNEPTDPPTNSPTLEPTDPPTSNPTSEPTESPTSSPTNSPTTSPTSTPTAFPTLAPTSLAPVEACIIDINFPEEDANFTNPEIEKCFFRPSLLALQYIGGSQEFNGSCSSSVFCEENDFTCEDFVPGALETLGPDEIWIEAYGRVAGKAAFTYLGKPVVRTQGEFQEGFMNLTNQFGGDLDPDQIIDIYQATPGPNGQRIGPILQSSQYHVSCSQPLVCFNIFGATSVVGYQNPEQGFQNCLATSESNVTLEIPPLLPDSSSAIRIIRFALNITEPNGFGDPVWRIEDDFPDINGQVFPAGAAIPIDYTIPVDPRFDFVYEVRALLLAVTEPGGLVCEGDRTDVYRLYVDGAGFSNNTFICDDPETLPPN